MTLAMTLLMTSGEFDLSVGSLFGFSPVLAKTGKIPAGLEDKITAPAYDGLLDLSYATPIGPA